MMIRRLIATAILLAVVVYAVGAQVPAVETAHRHETSSAVHYRYRTPELRALKGEWSVISVRLPDLPYIVMSGGPTWRALIGVRHVDQTGDEPDSAYVHMWHGYSEDQALIFQSAEVGLVPYVPKAIDITTIALTAMPHLSVMIANADSSAAAYDVELTVLKGR